MEDGFTNDNVMEDLSWEKWLYASVKGSKVYFHEHPDYPVLEEDIVDALENYE